MVRSTFEQQAGVAIGVDLVMVVLFTVYLAAVRRIKTAA